ncbi:MAG: signal peptidase II [Oscillospiraceae bacterium]|nr:signal peptidase II [Oscillospiraceae bacterium]
MFYACLALVAAAAVALDQITKALTVAHIPLNGYVEAIPGLFHLTYIQNSGAAFSMLEGGRIFFLIVTVVFLAGVCYCVVKKVLARPYLWILAVIAGGAVGNLIDRLLNGSVVDMIVFDFVNFAIFNVADIFVTCGAVALVLYALFFDRKKKETPHADGSV